MLKNSKSILLFGFLLIVGQSLEAMKACNHIKKDDQIGSVASAINCLLEDRNTSANDRDLLYQASGYRKPVERFVASIEDGHNDVQYFIKKYRKDIVNQSEKTMGFTPLQAAKNASNEKVIEILQAMPRETAGCKRGYKRARNR